MNEAILIYAFGTFGSPNGFKQTGKILGNKQFSYKLSSFDLKTNAIQLFANKGEVLYALKKELVEDKIPVLSYVVYTFAREQNSTRGGSFIGSAISFVGKKPATKDIINTLNEFHGYLVGKNTDEEHTLLVDHSDKFEFTQEIDQKLLYLNQEDFGGIDFEDSKESLVYYTEKASSESVISIFDRAEELLNIYDTIYFTNSLQTAEFAQQKGIFDVVGETGFEKEFAKIEEKKKKRIMEIVAEYRGKIVEAEKYRGRFEEKKGDIEYETREKYKRAEEKLKQELREGLEQELRKRLEQEFRKRLEKELSRIENELNQEYTNRVAPINKEKQKYTDFIDETNRVIKKVEEGKLSLKEIKRMKKPRCPPLNNSLFVQTEPIRVAPVNVSSSQPASQQRQYSHQSQQNQQNRKKNSNKKTEEETPINGFNYYNNGGNEKDKNDIWCYIAMALAVILFAFMVYILLRDDSKGDAVSAPPEQEASTPNTNTTTNLTLEPNGFLSNKDRDETVKKQLKNEMILETVVAGIFKGNPNDIGKHYNGQMEQYGKLLEERNKEAFEEKDGNIILKDTSALRVIPCYKKE